MTRKKGFFIASVAIALFALGWGLTSKGKDKQTSKPTGGFVLAKESKNEEKIEVSGFAQGTNRANIAPMASGKIIKLLKHEGEKVSKGQVLAIIEATQADAQLAAASATIKSLEKTVSESEQYYNQLVDEAKKSGANDESIQSAKRARDLQIQATKSQLAAANGALEIARAGKGNLTLTAPFAGTIIAINGREGSFANFSMPLISLSTENSKEIETYVASKDGENIHLGMSANFKTENGKIINGTVSSVAPASERSNFKNFVRISLNDESNIIKLGDFLKGEIIIPSEKNLVSIPRQAIVSRQGIPVVFILDEKNISHEELIEVESENENDLFVSKGIVAGQKIVVEGQQYLKSNIEILPYESK